MVIYESLGKVMTHGLFPSHGGFIYKRKEHQAECMMLALQQNPVYIDSYIAVYKDSCIAVYIDSYIAVDTDSYIAVYKDSCIAVYKDSYIAVYKDSYIAVYIDSYIQKGAKWHRGMSWQAHQ